MIDLFVHQQEAEQAQKYRTSHGQPGQPSQQKAGKQGGSADSSQQRLDDLEAEKRRIEQEIADLKRQKR